MADLMVSRSAARDARIADLEARLVEAQDLEREMKSAVSPDV